jgi:hypothetical protein
MVNQSTRGVREQFADKTQQQAARSFADTRWNWLRQKARRRALVLVSFSLVSLYGLALYFDWVFVALPALLSFMGTVWLMRVVVRGITDYPDELVDERMREVRGLVYRYAFLATIGLISVYMAAFIINQVLAKAGWAQPMSADQLHDLSFWLFFACMALPSAIFAWREPEI